MPLDSQAPIPMLAVRRRAGFRWLFVMKAARRERLLGELPRPEKILHLVPARDREDDIGLAFVPWKPSVHALLDALHGWRSAPMPKVHWYHVATEEEKRRGMPDRPRYYVERPSMVERIERYRKALGIVYTFSSWEDLTNVAVYRREISNQGGLIEIDLPFFLLVQKAAAARFFRPIEIRYLGERMPPRSAIRGMLFALAASELLRRVNAFGSSKP